MAKIGSLQVNLEAKTAAFQADMKKAANSVNRNTSNINKSLISMQKGFKTAATLAAGFLAVLAVSGRFNRVIDEMDEVSKAARRLGVSTEELSALSHAAELSGGSFETLEKSLKKMMQTLTFADEGLKTYQRSFERIGINLQDLEGLSTEEKFIKIASALASVDDEAKKTASALEIFGKGGSQVITMAEQGEEALRGMTAEARELGKTFTEEAGAKAEKFNDTMTRFQAKIDGLMMSMADSGALEAFTTSIVTLGEAIGWAAEQYGALIRALGAELNADDSLKRIRDEALDDLREAEDIAAEFQKKAAQAILNRQGEAYSSARQTANEALKEIERLETVISNLDKNYIDSKKVANDNGFKPSVVTLPKNQSGGSSKVTAAQREQERFANEIERMQQSILSIEQQRAIEMEKINKALSDGLITQEEHEKLAKKIGEEYKTVGQEITTNIGDGLVDSIRRGEDAMDAFKELALDALSEITKKAVNDGLLDGLFGGSSSGGSGIFGSIGSLFGGFASFDGGGYTGSSARAGGVDGKGGFPAILHGNETVVDHTKGQTLGGGTTVININTVSEKDIDSRVMAILPFVSDAATANVRSELRQGGQLARDVGLKL